MGSDRKEFEIRLFTRGSGRAADRRDCRSGQDNTRAQRKRAESLGDPALGVDAAPSCVLPSTPGPAPAQACSSALPPYQSNAPSPAHGYHAGTPPWRTLVPCVQSLIGFSRCMVIAGGAGLRGTRLSSNRQRSIRAILGSRERPSISTHHRRAPSCLPCPYQNRRHNDRAGASKPQAGLQSRVT